MKDRINNKRDIMHEIMLSKDVKYEDILKISRELDELILEYYETKNNDHKLKKE